MGTVPRVLIVDDFSETALLLSHLLASMGGFETRTATDGFQAIGVAEEFRPQFVLLDIAMPSLNGFEAAKRIRAQPWGKDIMLIAMSASWDEEYDMRARKAGFKGYVLKPMPVKSVVDLIEKCLRGDCDVPSSGRQHRVRSRRPLLDRHL